MSTYRKMPENWLTPSAAHMPHYLRHGSIPHKVRGYSPDKSEVLLYGTEMPMKVYLFLTSNKTEYEEFWNNHRASWSGILTEPSGLHPQVRNWLDKHTYEESWEHFHGDK